MSQTYQCMNILCGEFVGASDRVQVGNLTYCEDCASRVCYLCDQPGIWNGEDAYYCAEHDMEPESTAPVVQEWTSAPQRITPLELDATNDPLAQRFLAAFRGPRGPMR